MNFPVHTFYSLSSTNKVPSIEQIYNVWWGIWEKTRLVLWTNKTISCVYSWRHHILFVSYCHFGFLCLYFWYQFYAVNMCLSAYIIPFIIDITFRKVRSLPLLCTFIWMSNFIDLDLQFSYEIFMYIYMYTM